MTAAPTIRFVHEVALAHEGDECLMWPFSLTDGYGKIKDGEKWFGAHRYICLLVHGDPPSPNSQASHSCGNGDKGCVSPNHISWKTPSGNQSDRLIHGTHSRGERSGTAKLTEQQAREILRLKGKIPQTSLAKRYGVAPSTIGMIHNGTNWFWLPEAGGRGHD